MKWFFSVVAALLVLLSNFLHPHESRIETILEAGVFAILALAWEIGQKKE
jgi:hypothetical protein